MNRKNSIAVVAGLQLTNAFLLFTFSIYLAVSAYPLVIFFEERNVTLTYIGNVTIFVVLAVLALVGWWGLRKEALWAWWLAVSSNVVICALLTLDSLSLGLRDTYFQPATIAVLSATGVVLLFMPAVRRLYFMPSSIVGLL